MKAAIVERAGHGPVYAEVAEPVPGAGEVRVTVTAAALSPLARGRAAGQHYSASHPVPFVVGVDGVGRLDDGRRVYFALPRAPHGAMAERTVVPAAQCLPLPDGLDDVTAAAIANPGLSSWAACIERARLRSGETVLINGATGTAGRLAVQIARHLGAGRVIATGRDPVALRAVGADVTVPLVADDAELAAAFREQIAAGVDVVIDYLWGRSAAALLNAAAQAGRDGATLRFVQVGSASGADLSLPAAVLRAAAIELMGSGIGSVRPQRLFAAINGVLTAAGPAGFSIATTALPLSEVGPAWERDGAGRRLVFLPSR